MSSWRASSRREARVDRAVMELSLYVPRAPATAEERAHWDKNMQLVLDVVTGEDFPAGRTHPTRPDFGRADPHGVRPQRAGHDPLSSFDASGTTGPIGSRRRSEGRCVGRVGQSCELRNSRLLVHHSLFLAQPMTYESMMAFAETPGLLPGIAATLKLCSRIIPNTLNSSAPWRAI